MINAFFTVLKCLELYLSLKNKLFYYEIIQKSNEKQKDLISQIEKLRAKGDSNSSDLADSLRGELARERQEIEHLSTFYSKASSGTTNSNN